MMIPIASMTVQELRAHASELLKADTLAADPGRVLVHNYVARLIGEIARMRDLEVVVCRTKWSDHEPVEGEPVQLELIELTQLMGARNG